MRSNKQTVLGNFIGEQLSISPTLSILSHRCIHSISHPAIRQARSVLMNSQEISEILEAWYQPPRPSGSTNVRPRGAKRAIQEIAQKCTADLMERELVTLYKLVYKDTQVMKENEVTSVHIDQLTLAMREGAPTLWKLLEAMASTRAQKRNIRKRPEKVRSISNYY